MWRARAWPLLSFLVTVPIGAAPAPAGAQPACTPRSFCTADVDGDGSVGISDLAAIVGQYGGHPDRNANGDVDGDGWVGIADVAEASLQFGRVCPGDCPVNQPLDFDQDGFFDFIACGDFNLDRRLTMDLGCPHDDPAAECTEEGDKGDLLACLETLDDPDGRILEILPGRYEVPDEPFTAHNGRAIGPDAGLLNLPSNTRVHCYPGAILMGTDERHLDPPDQVSVLHVPSGASNVVIEGCEIDQGWPDGYDCSGGACGEVARMGVLLYGDDSIVRDNVIHHTRHSCIYTKRGDRNLLQNNALDWCGGAWSPTPGIAGYAGIYAYSDMGLPTDDLTIVNTTCDRTRAPCINTRLSWEHDADRIGNLYVAGTRHVVTGNNANGSTPECVRLRGVDDALLVDTWCEGTRGLHLVGGDGRYRDDPGCSVTAGTWLECVNSNLGVTIRDATVLGSVGDAALDLGAWSKEIRVEDVTVDGTGFRWPCVAARGPYHGLVVDGLDASACGAGGIEFGRTYGGWTWGDADAQETVVVRNTRILDADADLDNNDRGTGIAFHQGCIGCTVDNVAIHGWTDYGIAVGSGYGFASNVLHWLDLEQMGSWYRGERATPFLPACDASRHGQVFTVVDAVGRSSCAGGGSFSNLCFCDGSAWRDTDTTGGSRARSHGIHLTEASFVDDNRIDGVVCTNARYDSHCIELPGVATGNEVREVLAEDKRGLQEFDPDAHDANNGAVDLNGAIDTVVEDVTCAGLRDLPGVPHRQCVCTDAACTPE